MNLFSFIKSRVAILDVISEYTKLRKAGLYWKGTCPFHHEKTASFTVSPHKEIFYCFGCHSGGDVISFIAKIEQCSQIEAAQQLAEKFNLELPEDVAFSSSKNTEEKKQYFEVCALVAQWCHEELIHNKHVLGYLHERNITSESVKHFSLGYFPGGLANIKKLLNYAKRHNFLATDLVNAQILSQGKTVLYSPFEERIIFPIYDNVGRCCGFGGRIFKEHDDRAKYYNSRENEYFAKGHLLFGLSSAKQTIQKKEAVFLVEGYTDCIAMVQNGFTNTVAALGTACTLDHLKQLGRYAEQVYVLYDSDKAGQQAMLRLAQLCWQVTVELKIIELPNKEDPASFLNKGHSLDPLIKNAQDIFSFYIATLTEQYAQTTLRKKLTLARKILTIIEKINDQFKQDILLHNAAKMLDIPYEILKDEVIRLREKDLQKKPETQPTTVEPVIQGDRLEKMVFFAIMNNIELLTGDNHDSLKSCLPQPLNTIADTLYQAKLSTPSLDFPTFFDALEPSHQQIVSNITLTFEEPADEPTFKKLLAQLHKKHWKTIVHRIKDKLELAKNNNDEKTIQQIMHNFVSLKKTLVQDNETLTQK